MIERFLRKNIVNLNYHLTMGFLESKSIFPTDDEAIIITNFLKENVNFILNDSNYIYNLKGMIREDIFNGILHLYNEYKNRYLN
ncbi:MAG: hypothetical protein PUB03_03025 [bacterium]|nr:hypothetical protein [bacterium]